MSSASALRPRSSPHRRIRPEVADEAAVVAAEAAEEERCDRPGADLALPEEARPRRLPAGRSRGARGRAAARYARGRRPGARRRPLAATSAAERRARPARSGESVRPGVRDAREPHDRALDAACLGERHELARETGHQRVDAGALARMPASRAHGRPARPAGRRARPWRGTARCRRRRRAGSAGGRAPRVVGRVERDSQRPSLRCATRACAGPGGVAKTSSAPSSSSRSVPSRTPPSVIRR